LDRFVAALLAMTIPPERSTLLRRGVAKAPSRRRLGRLDAARSLGAQAGLVAYEGPRPLAARKKAINSSTAAGH
jgi:hypothetical protein